MNEESSLVEESPALDLNLLNTDEVMNELPKEEEIEESEKLKVTDVEPLNDNSYVIGDYTDDVEYIDDSVPSDDEVK